MRRALGRNRRDLGRSQGARLHRDAAAGRGVGAKPGALLADTAWRHRKPQRRPNALADSERALIGQSVRRSRARESRVGRRPVPCSRNTAGLLDHDA